MKLSSNTYQPLCSQDSRPGHQSVECGSRQTCWGLPVSGKPEHGVVFVTLSSAVLETSPSRSKSIPQVSSPMLHHLLRSSTYHVPGTMQPWGSNVEQNRYTQAVWRTYSHVHSTGPVLKEIRLQLRKYLNDTKGVKLVILDLTDCYLP